MPDGTSIGALIGGPPALAGLGICPLNGTGVDVIICVISAPPHVQKRVAIRNAWLENAARRHALRLAFFLGESQDEDENEAVIRESRQYRDVVQFRIRDSTDALTLKTIGTLDWVSKHCSKAAFLLKADDDVFINVPVLERFILHRPNATLTIYGRLALAWPPIRDPASKYHVSRSRFPAPVYPNYTTGPAYLMTRDCVSPLLRSALPLRPFPLEDVFVTGVLAERCGVGRRHAPEFLNLALPVFDKCQLARLVAVHRIRPAQQYLLQRMLKKVPLHCSKGVGGKSSE